MNLTKLEQDKFVMWLLQDADNCELLAKQMESLPGTSMISKKYRTEAIAQRIVAQKLQGYETVSVNG